MPWELTHACLWRIPGWPLAPTPPSAVITAGLVLVWVLVAAYLVSMLVSKKHQALYDWIAGTYVIVVPHPRRTRYPRSIPGRYTRGARGMTTHPTEQGVKQDSLWL